MEVDEKSVNYIAHLSTALFKFQTDERLNPAHISLYVSLFQCWNYRRFQNPFLIIRDEIMQASKIRSKSTYHRCIRELDSYGYIKYQPSKNAMTGSWIRMINFRKKSSPKFELHQGLPSELLSGTAELENEFHRTKNELPNNTASAKNGLPIEPFNKHIININKHINLISAENEFSAQESSEKLIENYVENKGAKKGNSVKFTPPNLEEVTAYFREKSALEIEAQKFFNYFESNGWKIGGRSPMKKWKAAANNWILNADKYNPKAQQSNLHLNQDKDYDIPL